MDRVIVIRTNNLSIISYEGYYATRSLPAMAFEYLNNSKHYLKELLVCKSASFTNLFSQKQFELSRLTLFIEASLKLLLTYTNTHLPYKEHPLTRDRSLYEGTRRHTHSLEALFNCLTERETPYAISLFQNQIETLLLFDNTITKNIHYPEKEPYHKISKALLALLNKNDLKLSQMINVWIEEGLQLASVFLNQILKDKSNVKKLNDNGLLIDEATPFQISASSRESTLPLTFELNSLSIDMHVVQAHVNKLPKNVLLPHAKNFSVSYLTSFSSHFSQLKCLLNDHETNLMTNPIAYGSSLMLQICIMTELLSLSLISLKEIKGINGKSLAIISSTQQFGKHLRPLKNVHDLVVLIKIISSNVTKKEKKLINALEHSIQILNEYSQFGRYPEQAKALPLNCSFRALRDFAYLKRWIEMKNDLFTADERLLIAKFFPDKVKPADWKAEAQLQSEAIINETLLPLVHKGILLSQVLLTLHQNVIDDLHEKITATQKTPALDYSSPWK